VKFGRKVDCYCSGTEKLSRFTISIRKEGIEMKRKKKGVKRTRRQKQGECFICGTIKNLQDHHIIPRCIGGKNLKNNKAQLCANCHKKLHILLDPVIAYLGKAILSLEKELKQERSDGLQAPIGFRFYKNGGKRK